jgi:predicted GNAT superfamily acetyltransferase
LFPITSQAGDPGLNMTTDDSQSLSIRDIGEIPELRKVEELQKEVWGIDDREIFPALAMVPMRELGAVLIGAFDGDRMIGFVFGFPGYEDGRIILHSDMLAVRSEYRSRGVGYKLKLAQREKTLAQGIDTITWTFDPLQALNAHLNISRLGVMGDSYRVNYYGETTSFLHRTGTDRLWVRWLLRSERVKERIAGGPATETSALADISSIVRVGENQEPISSTAGLSQESLAIEIPANINMLLKENVELAVRWREATRNAFTRSMSAGFLVEEFYRVDRGTGKVGIYLLSTVRPTV